MNITLEDVRQRYMQAPGREVPPDTCENRSITIGRRGSIGRLGLGHYM